MWQGERKAQLPPNWSALRSAVLKRDPHCKIANKAICTVKSTEVDHVTRGNNHSMANLRGVCHNCHAWKSSREGHEAKRQRKERIRRVEQHPGVIDAS